MVSQVKVTLFYLVTSLKNTANIGELFVKIKMHYGLEIHIVIVPRSMLFSLKIDKFLSTNSNGIPILVLSNL